MRRITMVLITLAMVFFITNQSLAAMGDVVDQFPIPDEISHVFDNGIAWDGDNLWVPCRSPAGGYYLGPHQIDPETGQLTGKALPNTRYSVAGIAFDRSKRIVWHLAYPSGPIYGVNVDTGSTVASFNPGVSWLHDIAFDGRYLWVTKDNGSVYQFDPYTRQRVGSFVGPGGITNPYGEGPNLQGVTHDGRYFWFTRAAGDGSDNQRYYKVDPEIALRDGHSEYAIVGYLDLPFASTLASDGKYLWTSYHDSATGMKMIAKIDTGSLEPIEPEPIEPYPSAAQAGVLYGVDSRYDGLYTIDLGNPESAAITFIGTLDPDHTRSGLNSKFVTPCSMAVDPSDGTLFVWNNTDSGATHSYRDIIYTGVLLTVDKCTGIATVVGPENPQGLGLGALAFGPDNKLYGLNYSLYEIDTETGQTTPIGGWLGLRIGAADFDPLTGTLYGIELTLYGPPRLVTINTNTGRATVVGRLSKSFGVIGSMVFTEAGTIIGSAGFALGSEILFEMDTTGQIFRTWKIPDIFIPQGLAFAPPCKQTIHVEIDIKPGSDLNPINLKSNGVIPVAVLTTDDFDATTVDAATVRFGPEKAEQEHYALEDVDNDGDLDMILHFRTQDTGIGPDDDEAILTGETLNGDYFTGTDSIRIVPQKGKK